LPTVAKATSNWISGELSASLNAANLGIEAGPVRPANLARLIALTLGGALSNKLAKEVFAAMWAGEHAGNPDAIIAAKGLQQISDAGAIERIVDEVLATNAPQVADYKAGKEKAFNSLVGQVMKATKGKANPAQVNDLLRKKLRG
jgi:aspartyl-tRNA(Asn)/glutamyl-tRNA(Gln) amidotransferase subunit B